MVCAGAPADLELYRAVVRDVVYHLPRPTGVPLPVELAPGTAWGSLYTVLLTSGEVIAYNHGDQPVRTRIRERDVEVAPKSIVSVR